MNTARADCGDFPSSHFEWAKTAVDRAVEISITSQQDGNLATYVGASTLAWDGIYYLSSQGYRSLNPPSLFSDRISGAQPFSIAAEAVDEIDVWLDPTGKLWIRNNRWGTWATVSNPTCTNNVLYGFGTRIGNSPGAPTLYTMTIKNISLRSGQMKGRISESLTDADFRATQGDVDLDDDRHFEQSPELLVGPGNGD